MDFYKLCTKEVAKGKELPELYPDFVVGRSQDLMVRGKSFYAVWDEEAGLWSTDEYDVQRMVDNDLTAERDRLREQLGVDHSVKYLRSANSGVWYNFRKFLQNVSDNSHQLDEKLTFANTEVKKSDYVSRRLPYPLAPGDYSAWDELVGTLYSVDERAKIEWAIGAIVSGDSKKIQKFLVFYGPPGSGKSTILNIIQKLFDGYTTTFDAKALGSAGAAFATEVFKDNPLVGIQHDGDLSKIEDNARLNSIISHEMMPMNEKFKPGYTAKVLAFLLMGTNQPVKISDAKSGIIRRLIDVSPTGVKLEENHYHTLMAKIDFELGAIAHHCLEVYRSMGKNFYSSYRPMEMMLQTDVFFNFIEAYYDTFKQQDHTTLKQAYALYKEFCSETGIGHMRPQYQVREELRNYFNEFHDRKYVDGSLIRSYYEGFNANKFKEPAKEANTYSLVLDETESLLDEVLQDQPAQGFKHDPDTDRDIPRMRWSLVRSTLSDLATTKELHFVKIPTNHIVIDFDLTDETGEKSLEMNLAAASSWPSTYAELSKGGNGVHLHYYYDGDVTELASVYSHGIEIKTLLGDSSLRRRLSKCNNVPIATINSGLPIKEKKVLPSNTISSEKGLRELIERNLRKEIHPGTKPSIDFIKKILDEAYSGGVNYDLTDMRGRLVAFANNSSNQAPLCLKIVLGMKFKGQDAAVNAEPMGTSAGSSSVPSEKVAKDDRLAFYDIEVYPNLFVVCWKFQGADEVVRMINPTPAQVEELFKLKLVGFNNRRYDNHILYAAFMGYDNQALYEKSKSIIESKGPGAMFGEAYNLSHADIYDYSSKKQGLKKFQIELGIPHVELDIPWDEPVPEELWEKVTDYCCNDVESTEKVFEARKQDYIARQILADLSGLTVNDTTQKHTARIIFGGDRNAQSKFVYTDLKEMFPDYDFDVTRKPEKSLYRGEEVGEGGLVRAKPGVYENVVLLDVASMHPTSIEQLNLFGPYTENFAALTGARLAIKHGDYTKAKQMLDGKLSPYLNDEEDAEALSYALKIVINIVYGLTSAKFDNPFRDHRNVDNIVAKRGALFMLDLKHYVEYELKLEVVHIKTDSIKVVDPTDDEIALIMEFGQKYGYTFEHEATYSKFALVNDAVYIAKYGWAAKEKLIGKWYAVGAQFQHPYVYKTLFTNEEVTFEDLCETKNVIQGAIYMDFDSDRPVVLAEEMKFIGRIGRFIPVLEGSGGGVLYRRKDDKNYAVAGTKGYYWLEAEEAKKRQDEIEIDMSYYEGLAEDAKKQIEQYASYSSFVNEGPVEYNPTQAVIDFPNGDKIVVTEETAEKAA